MKHLVSYRARILGACAVAAATALASQAIAHGAMGMPRAGTAMPPQMASPHPFDPSGHLGGPTTPTPITRPAPSPSTPMLDPPPPGADPSRAAEPPGSVGPHPFDPSGHLNGPPQPTPAPRPVPYPSAPMLDPPGGN